MRAGIAGGVVLFAVLVPALCFAQTTSCSVGKGMMQCVSPNQMTNCTGGQGLVTCNTTNTGLPEPTLLPPPPRDNTARQNLADAEAGFGEALGEAFARLRARAEQRRQENRQLAETALQRGDCATAHAMVVKDKDMLTYIDGTCAHMQAVAAQQAAQTRAAADVQAFANDPSHPRFMEVRGQMSDLLRNGQAHTLQEAYDLATAAAPAAPSAPVQSTATAVAAPAR